MDSTRCPSAIAPGVRGERDGRQAGGRILGARKPPGANRKPLQTVQTSVCGQTVAGFCGVAPRCCSATGRTRRPRGSPSDLVGRCCIEGVALQDACRPWGTRYTAIKGRAALETREVYAPTYLLAAACVTLRNSAMSSPTRVGWMHVDASMRRPVRIRLDRGERPVRVLGELERGESFPTIPPLFREKGVGSRERPIFMGKKSLPPRAGNDFIRERIATLQSKGLNRSHL